MNQRLLFWLKVIILLGIAYMVGKTLYQAWGNVERSKVAIDWRWGGIALAGFAGSMLTSACVWRWLAHKMGDRCRTIPLLASYTYSQMGKYFIGKVVLLLMRIERTQRFGMDPALCTLSTLLENALYMISGALVGMMAIVRITAEIDDPKIRVLLWPVTIAVVLLMIAACAPPIFYPIVNRILRKMKQPEVQPQARLGAGTLALAVLAFTPCWFFGGLAMWGSCQCVHLVPPADCWWFAGAYALSVIIGMASLLPGGALIREAVLGAAAALQFSALPGITHADAVLLGSAVAILQRIFQLIVEMLLGVIGMAITARPSPTTGP